MKKHVSIRWPFALCLLNILLGIQLTFAQDLLTRVTVNTSGKDMVELLSEIQKKTDLKFVYNPEEVSIVKASNKVFKDQSVKSVIEQLGYTASENGSNVVVSKAQRGKTAQDELRIVGTVIDTLGEPLAGVSILVKGTTRGTSTDLNGNFVLTAPADAVLVFTYVSFRTLEVPVKGRSTLNVTLEDSESALEAVVNVGSGAQE